MIIAAIFLLLVCTNQIQINADQPDKVYFTTEDRMLTLTGYCPCELCCGDFADGITASGRRAVYDEVGIVAAPKAFPFGTLIYIEGLGLKDVQDRGGAIEGNRLDVLFGTHEEALEFGVRKQVCQIFWDIDEVLVGGRVK